MLCSLTSLLGSSILAQDGEMGHVREILFHDRSWLVRYLVIETGSWLSGRRVLLSPTIAQAPESDGHSLRVLLSREQVRNSPSVETDLPVSRHQEIAMRMYYGWPAYWTGEAVHPVSSSQDRPLPMVIPTSEALPRL